MNRPFPNPAWPWSSWRPAGAEGKRRNVVGAGLSPEQAVDEAIARLKQILRE